MRNFPEEGLGNLWESPVSHLLFLLHFFFQMRWEDILSFVLQEETRPNQIIRKTGHTTGWPGSLPLFPLSQGNTISECSAAPRGNGLLYCARSHVWGNGCWFRVRTTGNQTTSKMGKRVASQLVKMEEEDLSASADTQTANTRSACVQRQISQPTCTFTAMTICTEMKKLQGHGEEAMWLPNGHISRWEGVAYGRFWAILTSVYPHSRSTILM